MRKKLDTTAQQEVAEATPLFDLPEHRLDDLLPQSVPDAPSCLFELSPHRLGQWPSDLALGLVGVFGAASGDLLHRPGILKKD